MIYIYIIFLASIYVFEYDEKKLKIIKPTLIYVTRNKVELKNKITS